MLDGLGKIDHYMQAAVEMGHTALAVTDHGNVHAWLDFYESANKHGIKPILGIEAYQARKTRFDRDDEERSGRAADKLDKTGPYHLTLLAKNQQGYQNIIKMTSRSYTEGFYGKPRLDFDLLSEHSEGIIVLSGCLNGAVQQALLRDDYDHALSVATRFQDIVGKENFFIEVMDHGLHEQRSVKKDTVWIAEKIGAKVVPTGDCHYVRKEDAYAHDVLLCVSTAATLEEENRFKFFGPDFYLKSYSEMAALFPEQWLQNTMQIAEMVDVKLPLGELHFPAYPLDAGEPLNDYFEKHAWIGLKKRYGDPLPEEVVQRANHELGVVKRMGFQSYYLVVADIVNWAKDNGIRVGYGRGSAAGSILSYAFGITGLDPLRFGLLFERFLVEGRKSMPDIDLDFDDRYRDKVIDYVRNKYGTDRVANICTFSTIGARQAIRDAARVLGYDYQVGDRIAKAVPIPVLGVAKTLEESLNTPEFRSEYETEEGKTIIDAARGLEGVVRQHSIHAAGVVIAPGPIVDYVPIMKREGQPAVTQWEMRAVEKLGLLKIDFLALRNLGVIDMALSNIKKRRDLDLDLNAISLDDPSVYQQLKVGASIGTFQMEGSGMREMMLSLQPNSIEDIMALISLYRPGPMGSKMDELYIARKHGKERIKSLHPKLDQILEATYQIMLYQEDVLAVARHLAGFSAGEADDLRKAIGKKEMDKIGLFREKFVQGCDEADESLANTIYSQIEYFGGYGFNRAHAASYAMVSYVTAFLKTHYPVEYMAALLSSVADNKDKAALYLNECRRMGLVVHPPSINHSENEFKVISEKEILFGLGSINGIGGAIVEEILSTKRNYTSVYDFCRRCSPKLLHKSTLEHLAGSGAMDELIPEQPEQLMSRVQKTELLDREKDELSLYVTDHPLLGVWHMLEAEVTSNIADISFLNLGEQVVLAGFISSLKRLTTKRGANMARLSLEDMTGSIDVLVFPNCYPRCSDKLGENNIVFIDGRIKQEGDDENPVFKLYASDVRLPVLPEYSTKKPMVFRCDYRPSGDIIDQINQLIEDIPGSSPVHLEYLEGKHLFSVKFKKPTSETMESKIKDILDAQSF